MENLSSSFPRYPDLPSRITQDMESKDIIRLQRDLTTNALSLMGEGDKQRYDGLSEGYRRWEIITKESWRDWRQPSRQLRS